MPASPTMKTSRKDADANHAKLVAREGEYAGANPEGQEEYKSENDPTLRDTLLPRLLRGELRA